MEPAVLRSSPGDEFPTPERCRILELLNTSGDESTSIAQARVQPGITTQLHRLMGVDERYVIVEGTGEVEVAGRTPERVQRGDVVVIPRGVSQRITNTGRDDLVFLCVCTPRFRPASYESLESP